MSLQFQKLSVKTAFEVDIKCLDNLSTLITHQQGENSWGRTGEALGAGAKIYGYRVDNIHMETYRMLGGLHRNGIQGESEIELIMGQQEDEEQKADGVKDDED